MSIQFIIGNSGSGKTEYMYRQLVKEAEGHPRRNYLVIVPEQFTLQTQRKLVELSSRGVIMNVDVLSFKRLAYRVFDDLGIRDVRILEETGKNLVLRKVAQQNAEQLTVLRTNMNRMGYIDEVKSMISELMQYNISCELLEEYADAGTLTPSLAAKLRDVAVMYRGFEEFLRGRFITAEELLGVLEKLVEQSELLRDSVIAFDEFTGFTPVQNRLLSTIMRYASRMMFALTMDAHEDFAHSRGSHELFDLPKKTMRILMEIAGENRVEILEPVILGEPGKLRYADAPGLFFMEQNLFRPGSRQWRGAVEEITLASFQSPREELLYAAGEIHRLVRESGYRYREIAVVTGAVSNYSGYVEDVFAKYEIPYFLDSTKDILFHPFIEFIRSTLEVLQRDFTYEVICRFLRCGFCNIPQEQLDRLENYLLATGIRGKKMWQRRWLRVPAGMSNVDVEEMDSLRQEIIGIFAPILAVFSGDATATEEAAALYELIVSLGVERQLWDREAEYLARGEQVKSKEYGQIYRIVMELLDKYTAILGDEKLSLSEFIEVLEAGLDAAEVATIPPGYDSVTIGDIERTRLNHIKIIFFLGVNDGVIPKSGEQGGLISEYERELLRDAALELAPGAREQTFIQRYYLYLNMTKPSDRLYVSYVRVDSKGKALRPSYLIGVLRRMFPGLAVREQGEWGQETDNLCEDGGRMEYATLEAAKDYLIVGRRDEDWYSLARYFLTDDREERKAVMERLLDAQFDSYSLEPISRIVAQALYGRNLEGSVTRLERFAACAYAHFLRYGLRLRERAESGFAGVDMGNLYHAALERYSTKLMDSGRDWFNVSEDLRSRLSREAMEETVAEYPNLGIYARAADLHMTKRMQHIFDQTVWALTSQVRKGEFVPERFEVSFQEAGAREALRFSLGENESLVLNGRIDRVDLCRNDSGLHVKVIDYKSGHTQFDLVQIYQGLQLQLMVYMNAAEALARPQDGESVIPGGVLYYHIDDPVIEVKDGMTEEEARNAVLMQLRPDGLVNREEKVYRLMDRDFTGKSDAIPVTLKRSGEISESASHVADSGEFRVIQDYVSERIRQTGRQILDGDIAVNPYQDGKRESCTYCPYRAVCGFDTGIEGFGYRRLEAVSREEIIEKMRTDLARNKS